MSDPRWWWLPEARVSTVQEIREALARMRELLSDEWNPTVEGARDVLVDRVRGLPAGEHDALAAIFAETCGPARESSANAMVPDAIVIGLLQRRHRDQVPVPPSAGPIAHRIMCDAAFVAWLRLQALELVAVLDHPERDEWMRAAVRDPVLRRSAAYHVVVEGLVGPAEIEALLTDPHDVVRARTMVALVDRGTRQGLASVVEIALARAAPRSLEAWRRKQAQEILAVNRSVFVAPGGAC